MLTSLAKQRSKSEGLTMENRRASGPDNRDHAVQESSYKDGKGGERLAADWQVTQMCQGCWAGLKLRRG